MTTPTQPARIPFLAWLLVTLAVIPPLRAATNCVPPPPDLVAWWPGDGNANDIAGVNNGTLAGSVTLGSGLSAGAFHFQGNGSHVDCGTNPSLNPFQALSLEAWVYSEDNAGWHMIITKWDDNSGRWLYHLAALNGQLGFSLSRGGHDYGDGTSYTTPLPLRQWVHLVATADYQARELKLFTNPTWRIRGLRKKSFSGSG